MNLELSVVDRLRVVEDPDLDFHIDADPDSDREAAKRFRSTCVSCTMFYTCSKIGGEKLLFTTMSIFNVFPFSQVAKVS